MRLLLTSLSAACLVCALAALSLADDTKGKAGTFSGVLIDQHCGATMMAKDDPEKAAANHPRACAMKEACEKSGYALISGKKLLKFDEHGNQLAKDFLTKSKKDKGLWVTVEASEKGDELHVSAIVADHSHKE
jgi:hypothetical protein